MKYIREQYILYDSPIKKDLLKLFDSNQKIIIFDIGSCEGEDSIKYSKLFPNARIIAFEPLPDNQKMIRSNLVKYGVSNIEVVPIALSDTKGIVDFYVSSGSPEGKLNSDEWNYGNKSSSLLKPDKHLEITPWVKFDQVISVPTNTLEDVCKELNISSIDFIHMDVQGAELKVLKGAGELIRNIKVVWLEVSNITLYQNQPLKSEVERFMKQNGFCLFENAIDGSSGDQMYINRKYFRNRSWFLDFKMKFKFFNKSILVLKMLKKVIKNILGYSEIHNNVVGTLNEM